MGRAVRADEPGTVHGEAHRQLLDRHVMDDLVVGALQERRIDGRERLVAFGREPGREGDRVLLGDADIEGAIRKHLLENVETRAGRHGGVDGNDALVLPGLFDQAFGEHFGVGRRVGLAFRLRAGHHVERHHAVILVGRAFRRAVTLALLGHDVDEDRSVFRIAHVLEHRQQVIEIVTVDRPDVIKAELLEQRAAGPERPGIFLGALRLFVDRLRQVPGELLAHLAQ